MRGEKERGWGGEGVEGREWAVVNQGEEERGGGGEGRGGKGSDMV